MLELYAASIRRYLTLVAVVVMAFGGLSACAQNSTNNDQTPITIGVSLSFSGDFGGDGPAMKQGYQLWADTVNKNGGLLGRPVQLVILDDKSDPDLTAKNYKTLINVDHVNLLFGPFSTLLTKQAAPVAHDAGYALIEGAGGGPSVFDPGWNNLFAVSLPVAKNLTTFAYYILSLPQALRPKTAAYATSDDPFTEPQLRVAQQLLEKAGIKTVYDTNPAYDSTKITGNAVKPYAERVVQSHAEVDTEGAFVPNGWYQQADNFQNAQMVNDYVAQYGGTVDQINADVAEAYSVGQVLEQAVNKIQSIKNAKLIALLHSSEVFNTVQGSAQFDGKGRNMLAIAYLFQWQAGQFLPVYPSSAAVVNPKLN